MLTSLDYTILVIYLIGMAVLGSFAGGRQKSTTDYFLGGRDLPWWAVCFSIVATETSTLTVISVPAIVYGGSMTFLQLTFGYLLGRIIVSMIFLPKYYAGNLNTAYAFLGERFGDRMRVTAATTFLVTRMLADGVRMFATAIPIKVIADASGLEVSYVTIISIIGLTTVVYTLIGGIRAVIWMDVVQMAIYIGGAIAAVFVLMSDLPADWLANATAAGKTQIVDFGFGRPLAEWFTSPYIFWTALIGGAIFSMASHGTDQLIVQRLLTCRNKRESQIALVGSGIVVMLQFALFLFVGLLLWAHYRGASIQSLGLSRADEIFPRFIIEGLPPGVSGLILAGIIAAAMSTIASSLNSLASSTMLDLYERIRHGAEPLTEKQALRASRVLTFIWGGVFILFGSMFTDEKNPVVELGLAIASFTYGGLLGVFLLGVVSRRATQRHALIAFACTILLMVWVVFGIWYSPAEGWVFPFMPTDAEIAARGLKSVAWPWYTAIGSVATVTLGSTLGLAGSDRP